MSLSLTEILVQSKSSFKRFDRIANASYTELHQHLMSLNP